MSYLGAARRAPHRCPMTDDSVYLGLVALQPLPALLIAPRENRIILANDGAERLFGPVCRTGPLSDILLSSRPQVAVYLDAVAYFGRYVDRALSLSGRSGTPLRLQSFGVQVDTDRVLLAFLDLNELDRRNHLAAQEAHHTGGLMEWQNIYGFFREVEAQNHLILEAAGEGIYGINAEGKATFVNRAAQEMLGWSADDLIGKDLHAIIHHKHMNGDHFPAHDCPIYASFRRDETVRIDDDAFWRKDGKPILVEYVSTPIYDHGILAGAVVIFRDVTERRENERKLREAMAEVQQLRVKLEQENDYLLTEIRSARSHTGVVGISAAVRNLNAQIDLAARNRTNVLVTGPAGSGKSLTVSAIHEASDRAQRPLVRVNCGAKTSHELETELFGYRRGAFRGASRDVTGKLTLAQNGTLYLDEVSALPIDFQATLSGVLQDRSFARLGDSHSQPMSLTIVATSARDLLGEVRAGRFRQDLYFALNIVSISCDALQDRPEDIPYLAKHFLERTTRRLRLPASRLSKSNMQTLQSYDWPGNVRELENVIERAAILAQGGKLRFDFGGRAEAPNDTDQVLAYEELRDLEKRNLVLALTRCEGKVAGPQGAAKLLGLPATTVYSKLKAFDLDARHIKDSARAHT